jgi:hypothetical protein
VHGKSCNHQGTNNGQSGGSTKMTINHYKNSWLTSNEGGCKDDGNKEIVEKPNQLMPDGPGMTGGRKIPTMTANHWKLQQKRQQSTKSDPLTGLQGG